MLTKRVFIRMRHTGGRYERRGNFDRKRLPNTEEHCTGWYLLGLLPLFISVDRVVYLTDAK